jgi:DNA-binding transcriptional MocR family regulator
VTAIDFGSGRADPDTFPVEALKAAAVRALDRDGRLLTDYPGGFGHAGLRRAMARRESEREGIEVDPDQLILTHGSMQAVTLTAQTLQEAPGDPVIVEAFSYPGTLSAYRNLGLDLHGVPLDAGGIRLDALEAKLDAARRASSTSSAPIRILPASSCRARAGRH